MKEREEKTEADQKLGKVEADTGWVEGMKEKGREDFVQWKLNLTGTSQLSLPQALLAHMAPLPTMIILPLTTILRACTSSYSLPVTNTHQCNSQAKQKQLRHLENITFSERNQTQKTMYFV